MLTARAELDSAVEAVRERADAFARLPVSGKIALLRRAAAGVLAEGPGWVAAACRAKGLDAASSVAGEEWLNGPVATLRNLRLLIESLETIRVRGKPSFGRGARARADGRVEVDVFPSSALEGALFRGFTGKILLRAGVGERQARERQASFYARTAPAGAVSLILGAGNVSSIPPMDALYKLFVEGSVCVVKVNPVNEWVGPFLERAFAALVDAGYLRIVYGGSDAGAYLVGHAGIDNVHITGSDRTHDLIVWGPPGPERDRRKAAGDPLLKKRITSELGNVSPVAIVPGEYADGELLFQAKSVASMVVNNASFNCNAAKVLITGKGWRQRTAFLALIRRCLAEVPARKAYYPGAFDRYEALLAGRPGVETFGTPSREELAWALVAGVDSSNRGEALFRVEPFCGILSETEIASADPVDFLRQAAAFMNDRLWGTLNAAITISPRDERDPRIAAELDKAVVDLRYGSVCVNHWPALGYGFVTPAWGGHPSATLADIQSGLGWVHNTYMLEDIDKSVIRGPIAVSPKPAWFYDNRQARLIGAKLLGFEASPGWLKAPEIALAALRG